MILLDTSIRLQYFRGSEDAAAAQELVRRGDVAVHEFVIGELPYVSRSMTPQPKGKGVAA